MTLRNLPFLILLAAASAAAQACKGAPTAPPNTTGEVRAAAAKSAGREVSGTLAGSTAATFTRNFRLDDCEFATVGDNPFFPLKPGLTTVLEGVVDGERTRLKITVLHKTITIAGVRARVVEEREHVDGKLFEVSRNYFAHCDGNGTVFYLGEDVDFYENGQIVSHEGAWRHEVNGARAGVIMPGIALLGSRYFQEVAPGVALDRAEIQDVNASVSTPFRHFNGALLTEETTPLDLADVAHKTYAAGIGLVADGELRLTRVEGR
jgi:hypothetical protein